jgi:hypothetical protein
MIATPSKRIYINYCCPPLWNAALNFLFWMTLAVTGVVVAYLFVMYIMDTTIKADAAGPNSGPNSGSINGDPAVYDDVVERYIRPIPFIGKILYP